MTCSLSKLLEQAKTAPTPTYIRKRDGYESDEFWFHVDTEISKIRNRKEMCKKTTDENCPPHKSNRVNRVG